MVNVLGARGTVLSSGPSRYTRTGLFRSGDRLGVVRSGVSPNSPSFATSKLNVEFDTPTVRF